MLGNCGCFGTAPKSVEYSQKTIEKQSALLNRLDEQSQAQMTRLTEIQNNPSSYVAHQAADLGRELGEAIQKLARDRSVLQQVQGSVEEAQGVLETMKNNCELPRSERIGEFEVDEIARGAMKEVKAIRQPVDDVKAALEASMKDSRAILKKYKIAFQ